MIAALANHHKCPVLSSDSDFFIFKLEHGFIHFDCYFDEKENNSLFRVEKFMREFNLKECLLIPCVFGNDFIKSKTSEDCSSFLARIAGNDMFLKDYCSNPKREKKFKIAKQIYNIPNVDTLSLPQWAVDKFKKKVAFQHTWLVLHVMINSLHLE